MGGREWGKRNECIEGEAGREEQEVGRVCAGGKEGKSRGREREKVYGYGGRVCRETRWGRGRERWNKKRERDREQKGWLF